MRFYDDDIIIHKKRGGPKDAQKNKKESIF